MRRGFLCLIITLFPSFASAQHLVSGTVLRTDDSSGSPILEASVSITNNTTGETFNGISIDDGSFQIPGIPDGNYTISATHQRYDLAQSVGSPTFSLPGGQTTGIGFDGTLVTQEISGNVRLSNDAQTPVEGATVTLIDKAGEFDPIVTQTDPDGNYSIPNAPIGNHEIKVEKDYVGITRDFPEGDIAVNRENPNILDFSGAPRIAKDENGPNKVYAMWNGFLDIINILELLNTGDGPMTVKLDLRGATGTLRHSETFVLASRSQQDIIINDLDGFETNNYGVIVLEISSSDFDGRMTSYQQESGATAGASFSFVNTVPLLRPVYGVSNIAWNTMQPSAHPEDLENPVANWLAGVNLSENVTNYCLNRYDIDGNFITQECSELHPFQRADVDSAVEGYPIGMNEIVPENDQAPYILTQLRIGYTWDAQAGQIGQNFAIPILPEQGNSRIIEATISRGAGASNYVEVVNVKDYLVQFKLEFYDNLGNLLLSRIDSLGAHAQRHYDAARYLSDGQSGIVKLTPFDPDSLYAYSMFYFRKADGRINAVYGSGLKETFKDYLSGSWNLFLGMYNWLRMSNRSDAPVNVVLKVYSDPSQPPVEKIYTLAPNSGIDLGFHEIEVYGTKSDSYGTFEIAADTEGAVRAEMLRIKVEPTGDVDFAVPTNVR